MRRISTKLVVAVLTTVVLPFAAFAYYINEQMADRLTRHVVQQSLLGLAKDLAGQIDFFVEERQLDLEQWANAPLANLALDDFFVERSSPRIESSDATPTVWNASTLVTPVGDWMTKEELRLAYWNRHLLTQEFNRYLELKRVYDVILLVSETGQLVTCSSRRPEGGELEREFLEELFAHNFAEEDWFQAALEGSFVRIDHHESPFRLAEYGADQDRAWNYQIGFSAPVHERNAGAVRGVLFTLVNWWFVQDIVSTPVLKDTFRGLVDPEEEPSPYAWIWAADAETILGHPKRRYYYQSVVTDVKLPQLTEAVLQDEDGWGLYPEYTFEGAEKNAAFKGCLSNAENGFGWIVGVGINNDDIYATADELRTLLLGGTAFVVLLAVCATLVIARRIVAPIHALQSYTRKVAEGDLDAQVSIRSRDELEELAQDFNTMTRELKTHREQLVKAEKDAAWREMARQIAHDIKNPLTPMKLSLDLLERARREGAPGSDQILERTMELIRRQVENLREIAADFYEFTGGRKAVFEEVHLERLLYEVLHLHDAWAVQLQVDVHQDGEEAIVRADRSKLRRVFVNLVSNALHAMPDGGELYVSCENGEAHATVTIRDTGVGVPEEARAHLFEPYFTTRSEGTGLGLAISKRVVEEHGGDIAIEPAPSGKGTVARVTLPKEPPAKVPEDE